MARNNEERLISGQEGFLGEAELGLYSEWPRGF